MDHIRPLMIFQIVSMVYFIALALPMQELGI